MVQADRLEVTVLVENWVDMLLADHEEDGLHCFRNGLIEHFDPKRTPPQAENGISLLVTAHHRGRSFTTLFDVGLTGKVLEHNLTALGVDAAAIDHVVISHGHPDHYGGIYHLLDRLPRRVAVATHEDAFLARYAVMGDGRTSPFYNQQFDVERLEASGGDLVMTRSPLELGWGVVTTGEIPRDSDFEGPPTDVEDLRGPGLYQVASDGAWRVDEVWDEQALVVDVRGEGLVVMTGCAHAGVINTIERARALVGAGRPVRAVMGGFHLGFPTTPEQNVSKTVAELKRLEVQTIIPMHCSGLRAHTAISTELEGRYVQPAVGSTVVFGR